MQLPSSSHYRKALRQLAESLAEGEQERVYTATPETPNQTRRSAVPFRKWGNTTLENVMAITWKKTDVAAQEILDAVETLVAGGNWHETDLIADWTKPELYATWARECLNRNDAFGWDTAICYAKRAVCRRIDGFLVMNHLGQFAGRHYPEKLEIITDIGIFAPEVIHELVIDPRNDIEHEYSSANRQTARRAVNMCDMFLKSTEVEAGRFAIISFGNEPHQFSSRPMHGAR